MNPIEKAVAPLKQGAEDYAEMFARRQVAAMLAKIAEAGWDRHAGIGEQRQVNRSRPSTRYLLTRRPLCSSRPPEAHWLAGP